MTSDGRRAYVWTWLPDQSEPLVAGVLEPEGQTLAFAYGRSYLDNPDAVPLYLELPLEPGLQRPRAGELAGCLADAAPDAWGMRVILNRLVGSDAVDVDELGTLTYLLESGSERPGALDFQAAADRYLPRPALAETASLAQLARAAELVDKGERLPAELDQALLHGSSIGGARPKAGLADDERLWIAKFSSASDHYPVVKGEFLSMELAHRAGLDVANVELARALGRDVLLVERFDRPGGDRRRAMVSALTILGLDPELGGRYASYALLADEIRARFGEPDRTLRELFSRVTFNILTGNIDDHARNHSAFWDGRTETLTLTPAYDICPQTRAGGEQRQLMAIDDQGWRASQVAGCVERAHIYHLDAEQARAIVDRQIATIEADWDDVCDLAGLTAAERDSFYGRQYLHPYALEGYR